MTRGAGDGVRLAMAPLIALLLMSAVSCASPNTVVERANLGAPPGTGVHIKQFTDGYGTRKYAVFVPHAYTPERRWPTIVFLHGIGQGGEDGASPLTEGIGPMLAERAKDFPFIVVFPQTSGDWSGAEKAQKVLNTLKQVAHDYVVDADRVYLSGMAEGGYATWVIGAHHPDVFAAIAPMAPFGDDDDVPLLAKSRMPIWCFHNGGDPFALAAMSASMCRKIKEAGGNVHYTEYDAIGHDCWTTAYREQSLYNWMQQQRRPISGQGIFGN